MNNPPKKSKRLTELSKAILKVIGENTFDIIDVLTSIPPDCYQSGAYRVKYRHQSAKKRISDLRKSGFIKKDNKSFFHLTPKGRLEFLKILHLEKILSGKWDGHWRVIIFDIPEEKKKWREYLRRELRNLNFQQLQYSVYITPYPVTQELKALLEKWGMEKYFNYMTVTELDNEKELKKKFSLK